MQNAIEFITTKKNSRLIEIPEEYIDQISGEIKVILIFNTESEPVKPLNREFKAFKINTKGYKFNRDDAYDE